MKPSKSILDRSFVYVPSAATNVDHTWRRFGWRPITETSLPGERAARPTQSTEALATRQ